MNAATALARTCLPGALGLALTLSLGLADNSSAASGACDAEAVSCLVAAKPPAKEPTTAEATPVQLGGPLLLAGLAVVGTIARRRRPLR